MRTKTDKTQMKPLRSCLLRTTSLWGPTQMNLRGKLWGVICWGPYSPDTHQDSTDTRYIRHGGSTWTRIVRGSSDQSSDTGNSFHLHTAPNQQYYCIQTERHIAIPIVLQEFHTHTRTLIWVNNISLANVIFTTCTLHCIIRCIKL